MDYQKSLCYLNTLVNYEKFSDYNYANTYNLDRIHKILLCLGNPHNRYPSVIISGTKGKGSCACMLSSILNAAGIKTGKFTSPHLVSVRERIEVDGKCILKREFSSILSRIKKVITENRLRPATYFEVLTAAAFLYFARKNIDIAVLEVGLGGRLDATNTAQSLVAGIMPISYDHTHLLGTLLKDIAREKCGIIHGSSSVVSAPQRPEVLSVIKDAVSRKRASLLVTGKDAAPYNITTSLSGTRFDLRTKKKFYKQLHTTLAGRHQAMNAAVAIGLMDRIRERFGFSLEEGHVRRGLAGVDLPGRFQLLSKNPYVILDGAQNRASAKALNAAYNAVFKKRCSCMVLGVSADKDAESILRQLSPLADRIIFTKADSPRALEPELLAEKAAFLRGRYYVCYDIKDALEFASAFAERHGIILVTGSFFLTKETLEAVGRI